MTDTLTVEALVNGNPLPGPKPCRHNGDILVETLVAKIQDTEDPERIVGWQVRVKAICAICSADFDIDPQGRPPKDGSPGVVHDMTPSSAA